MTGEPSLPDLQYLKRVGQVVFRSVKKTVPKTRTNHNSDDKIDIQLIELFNSFIFFSENPCQYEKTGQKTKREQKTIPANVNRADDNKFGVNIPGKHDNAARSL